MPFVDLQSMLDEDYPDELRYYWKSIFLTEAIDEVVDIMVRFNEAAPSPLSTIDLWHLGGAVEEVPQDGTAFWHRDKPYLLNFEANRENSVEDDANVAWARDGIAETQDLPVSSGRYGNFPGLNEDPAKLLSAVAARTIRDGHALESLETASRFSSDPTTADTVGSRPATARGGTASS